MSITKIAVVRGTLPPRRTFCQACDRLNRLEVPEYLGILNPDSFNRVYDVLHDICEDDETPNSSYFQWAETVLEDLGFEWV